LPALSKIGTIQCTWRKVYWKALSQLMIAAGAAVVVVVVVVVVAVVVGTSSTRCLRCLLLTVVLK